MTKLFTLLVLLLMAQSPSPEIIAKPVPFVYSEVQNHYRAPLWNKGPGHRGIDLAIQPEEQILSPFDGEVFFAGKVFDRDVITLMSDTGLKASFEPVCSIHSKGTKVSKGQPVALLCVPESEYEIHCESCIHFSIRNQYGYLNPLLFYGMLKPAVLTS